MNTNLITGSDSDLWSFAVAIEPGDILADGSVVAQTKHIEGTGRIAVISTDGAREVFLINERIHLQPQLSAAAS